MPLVRFGMRAAASNIFEQIFKNVDYLLIGWFYGASPARGLPGGVRRRHGAGDGGRHAGQPHRPAGVRPRGRVKEQFVQSLTWSLRRMVTLVAPLMVALMLLAADPLTALIHDGLGNSYAAAALPLKLLAAAALLRVTSQLLSPVMMGRAGPEARLACRPPPCCC